MSTWLGRLKDFLGQLAAARAEMFAVREIDENARQRDGQQPIPFWLWHMF
jgi:hypothetical protein